MKEAERAAARINWQGMGVEEPVREVVTLTDPRLPGVEMVIELEAPDPLTNYKAAQIALEMIRRHITGDPEQGHPAFPFMVGERARDTTPEFWDDVGAIVAMQPEPWSLPFAPYDADDLAQMAYRSPRMWEDLWTKARELRRGGEERLKNASPEHEAGS